MYWKHLICHDPNIKLVRELTTGLASFGAVSGNGHDSAWRTGNLVKPINS